MNTNEQEYVTIVSFRYSGRGSVGLICPGKKEMKADMVLNEAK